MKEQLKGLAAQKAETDAFAAGMEAGMKGEKLLQKAELDSASWMIRVEALRAAATVAAAIEGPYSGDPMAAGEFTLILAKQFAPYLETGE